jgi:Outer membrane phospholipase A
MKTSISPFICILFFFTLTVNSFAQTLEMEEKYKQIADSSKIDFRSIPRPVYIEITEEEALKIFDNQPYFGMFKDNYIISGIPTNKSITRNTADAKYQVSIRHRLTKSVLPFNSFLMLTYTQKCFWDIYADSAPFGDMNFNPGLTLGKAIILDNKLRGMASFAFEHESNGKDSINSRSWNYFVLSGAYYFNANISAQGKLWAGWYGGSNKDLYKYRGFSMFAFNYRTTNDKWWFSAVVNPGLKFGRINTQVEINYKVNSKQNQYLFLQWFNGYAEGLYDYDKYTSAVRVGICIKPPLRNLY